MKQRLVQLAIAVTIFAGVVSFSTPARAESPACGASDVICYQPAAHTLIQNISTVSEPPIAVPDWLGGQ